MLFTLRYWSTFWNCFWSQLKESFQREIFNNRKKMHQTSKYQRISKCCFSASIQIVLKSIQTCMLYNTLYTVSLFFINNYQLLRFGQKVSNVCHKHRNETTHWWLLGPKAQILAFCSPKFKSFSFWIQNIHIFFKKRLSRLIKGIVHLGHQRGKKFILCIVRVIQYNL